MIVIKRKSIRSLERKSQLCLIIPLGGGAKAQYPISNEAEAIALYKEYLRLNPDLAEAEVIHG
ncbi:MAG: hypothetical protein ACFE0J_04045 [Elainellaceae cyanobacterium]